MNRFLVKIGKVWSLMQCDGLVRTLLRITGFIRLSFRRVGEGEILIVTGGIGDSALYRGAHVAEELSLHGFIAKTTTQDNPFLFRYLNRFDIFVLHRVSCSSHMRQFLAAAEKCGKTVLFETDDLTFDAQYIKKTDAYARMNILERGQYADGQSACVMQSSAVRHATTTTPTLAYHLEQAGKKVFVVPNKQSLADVALAESICKHKAEKPIEDGITIGYFSGSASHNRDFLVATDALLNILSRFQQVSLLLVGPLQLDKRFDQYAHRVIRKPYALREEHFCNVAQCDITIAPLEVGDIFCEAKSAIKFTEAGLVGVPIVASATAVFHDVIEDGVDGYVATTPQEWEKKLKQLVCDASLRRAMGQKAREKVLREYTTTSPGNEEYYTFLRQTLDGSTSENLQALSDAPSSVDTVVVIANWNGKKHLTTCLDALQRQTDTAFRVVVVENGSEDGSLDLVQNEYPHVLWIALATNTGFAHANNVGIRAACTRADTRYIITLNNDTEIADDYVARMRSHIHKAPAHVVALQPKVLNFYDKDTLDATGVVNSFEMSALNRGRGEEDAGQYDVQRDVFGPSASAALYTRKALEAVRLPHAGYFDKDYFAYYEDVDLAWRLHLAGYKTRFVPDARVYHVHSATGQNYSPFKAFHIHRNHYYSILKDAPIVFLLCIVLFIPIRYALLFLSVLVKRGASSQLHRKTCNIQEEEKIPYIVLRAWKDVIQSIPTLLRKRQYIQPSWTIGHRIFFDIMKRHRTALKNIIFNS